MTQPIQEPTVARSLRAQKYGIDQLFRRPCVSCADLPSAYLELDKADFLDIDDEALTEGTFFQTNDDSVFGWGTSSENYITPFVAGRYLSEVYVGVQTDTVQFARAPTDAAIVNVGMSYFDPTDPTPNSLDQYYSDFAAFNTAFGSETNLNLTRTFIIDLPEIFVDSCLQPLCWIAPAASNAPSFGNAVSFAVLRVTLLGSSATTP
jgi:hypothetical protein